MAIFNENDLPELAIHCQIVSKILYENKQVSSFDAQLLRNQVMIFDILIALLKKLEVK